MTFVKKGLTVGLVALTLATGVTATTPALAWHRGGFGAPLAAGLIGGLAAGAIFGGATRPAYGYDNGYGYGYGYGYRPAPVYQPCYRERQPVYDVYGNFAGYRVVRVCD